MSERLFRRFARPRVCTCGECAELDIHHPGEGVQLALAIPPPDSLQQAGRKDMNR